MSWFGGNAMLISPGSLVLDELLAVQDCKASFPSNVVAYDAVVPFKMQVLERAWKNLQAGRRRICGRNTISSAQSRDTDCKTMHCLEL
jgi:hypothetical protein